MMAALVWGVAFVPQRFTIDAMTPIWAVVVRFGLAAPLAIAVAGKRLKHPGTAPRHAVLLGALLFVAMTLQTMALVHAPVARVALITGLYAVFVPLLAPLFGEPRPTRMHWLGAALAFAGVVGLTNILGDKDATSVPLNIGDVYVLLHALLSAVQMILVGKLARRADPYALNAVQLTTIVLLAVPTAFLLEGAPPTWASLAPHGLTLALSFAFLAVFSTVIAFTAQIVGQRHASASTSSVIMLLETPIGVVAAMVLLHESMTLAQWCGAAVLLAGIVVSLRGERPAPLDTPTEA